MSEEMVRLSIDDVEVTVPKGTLIVDAAKGAGIDIPVFCYHPKLDPVGMCRMCLVEIGRPGRDRATGKPLLDESGDPVIRFGPNLETACTMPVGEGWVVKVNSERAVQGRKAIVEYLLTSHPLDCPICDKGGECPLQNLTMAHGPGVSRFLYDDKIRLAKHVPLGDLIFLDRERCIQCARCVRYQAEVVDDPVIGFYNRGRRLEIVTFSDPGFDSYFSGNTTDICPVGALTTADFRFGARPWELNAAASICPHCPVGCNLSLNTRREALSGGNYVVKRIMPRQNETVNEIWICDKGRFAHHFASSPERLFKPLVRVGDALVEASWEDAVARAAAGLREAGEGVVGVAGGRPSNEDLYNFRRLVAGLGGKALLASAMAGGDLVQEVGVAPGTDLKALGQGDAVLVIASDLQEEAPIWWHRLKQAADSGARLVVANARMTRLDAHASNTLRYRYGEAVHLALGLLHAASGRGELSAYALGEEARATAMALAEARNLMIFYGVEGLDYAGSAALAQASASFLVASGHVGRANNGLIAVWPNSNTQGAWDMGLRPPPEGVAAALTSARGAYVMAADPAGDDLAAAEALKDLDFLVVQELFLTPTARRADVVLPAQSFVERDGTYTSGERRVQRFYPALPPEGEARPDWKIAALLGEALGIEMEGASASAVMGAIAEEIADYATVSYPALAATGRQWPPVGGGDLYFGGTAYKNGQGLGIQLTSAAGRGEAVEVRWTAPAGGQEIDGLLLVPITRLYDRGATVIPSEILRPRLAPLQLALNPGDAERLGVKEGQTVELRMNGYVERVPTQLEEDVPQGVALLPRSLGIAVAQPGPAVITAVG